MPEALYHFFAAGAAWFSALCFHRVKPGLAVLHAATCGAAVALAALLLRSGGAGNMLLPLTLSLFLLSGIAVGLQKPLGWGAAFHSFLLASGSFSLFCLPTAEAADGGIKLLISGGIAVGLHILLTLLLRSCFPEPAWREAGLNRENGEISLLALQMYAIPGGLFLLTAAAALIEPLCTPRCFPVRLAFGGAALWLGVWLMILLPALRQERSTLEAEQQYRGEMQSFLNVIRSQRHDYNFHVQTIAGLIRQGQIEECLRYVNALEEDSAIMNAVLPVKDPAISAMIHNFQILSAREGINLYIDIHYDLGQIATNVYETNKIISNLLQNAIDEVSTHEDKSYGIHLTILKRGEFCVIRSSNKLKRVPDAEELGQIYQQGYTTKRGHDGVGLSSVRTLLARYHGTIYTQLEGDVIHFVAKVPINYAKEIIT